MRSGRPLSADNASALGFFFDDNNYVHPADNPLHGLLDVVGGDRSSITTVVVAGSEGTDLLFLTGEITVPIIGKTVVATGVGARELASGVASVHEIGLDDETSTAGQRVEIRDGGGTHPPQPWRSASETAGD